MDFEAENYDWENHDWDEDPIDPISGKLFHQMTEEEKKIFQIREKHVAETEEMIVRYLKESGNAGFYTETEYYMFRGMIMGLLVDEFDAVMKEVKQIGFQKD